MPRNGSGIYGLPAGTTAVPNTPIESAKYNAATTDIGEALTNSINVSGTAPYQANQPMGGFKHTNLGAGTNAADSVNLGQAQSNIVAHATAVGGTADAITATYAPFFPAWIAKMRFRFTAGGANTVAAPTVNVDGLGAKTIKKLNGAALGVGDIAGAGQVCECVYDGTDVILLNPALGFGAGQNVYTAKQTFNGPVVKGTTVLADAATIAWDLSTGADFKVTITSNRTLGAFTNGSPGQEGLLTVGQDGIGGWSLNLGNPVYDFWGPSIENIARGPNEETVYEYKVISSGSMILRRKGATSIGGSGSDLLDVKTASSSATIDFVLTKWLQLYDRFEIDFEDVLAATNGAALNFRTSSDGGSSFDSGAHYYYGTIRTFYSATDRLGDALAGFINLVTAHDGFALSNVAGRTAAGRVILHNPSAAQLFKMDFDITFVSQNAGHPIVNSKGMGVRDAAADVDAVRFFCSPGNIASGSFKLYGIRK